MSASTWIFVTESVYDEPTQTNSVDFIASGSTLNFSQFKSDVSAAFSNDFGGVYQCQTIGEDAGPYIVSYGTNQSKRLNMTGYNNSIGITGNPSIRPISEGSVWVSLRPAMTFFLTNISSSVTNEAVIKFGLTIVSTTAFSLSNVSATATFSDGSTAIATRFISESAGLGDTFFGFTAPSGQSISSIAFTNTARRWMSFDDVGFITAVIPSLSFFRHGSSEMRVAWTTNTAGFSLESTTSLPAQTWISVTNSPAVVGNHFEVIINTTGGQRFFRLRSP